MLSYMRIRIITRGTAQTNPSWLSRTMAHSWKWLKPLELSGAKRQSESCWGNLYHSEKANVWDDVE